MPATVDTPSVNTSRARLAGLSRHHPDNPEILARARRDLVAANAEQYIRRLVQSAPPLTQAQRDRLVVLLNPTSSGDAVRPTAGTVQPVAGESA